MKNIVAVEVDTTGECPAGVVFQRLDGKIKTSYFDFFPWFLSSAKMSHRSIRLNGDNELRWLNQFTEMEAYADKLKDVNYKFSLNWRDLRQQFMAQNPDIRLFGDMSLSDLVRMTIDIETTSLNPETGEILCIGVQVKQGDKVLYHKVLETNEFNPEVDCLKELTRLIGYYDPDTIEGHNIIGFDLPFILGRSARHLEGLRWGRDNSLLTVEKRKRNFRLGSHEMPIQIFNCFGRHIVDTFLSVSRYDVNTGGKLDSYGLKYVAEKLGLRKDDRVIVEYKDMVDAYTNHRDDVITYCLQDVQECADLGSLILDADFYLTQMLPDNFQNVLVSGTGMKINQILCTKYLEEKHSIPTCPTDKVEYEGGAVECIRSGVFNNVAKADVASLYPSIMLSLPVDPPRDTLGVFHSTLKDVTKRRLEAKKTAQSVTDTKEKAYWSGYEKALKVVINGMYGYLGCGMNFSDYTQAALVTSTGREIVTNMAKQLEEWGSTIIEIDTDGVYFIPPDGWEAEWVLRIFDLPEGINVEVEKEKMQMISIKAKNYVLAEAKDDDSPIKINYHGNSLRSRRDEPFAKRIIESIVYFLLNGTADLMIPTHYNVVKDMILNGEIPVGQLVKRERISDAVLDEESTKGNIRDAMDEDDKPGDYIYLYKKLDGTLAKPEDGGQYDYYHYWNRLYAVCQRFEPILKEYDIQLEKPTKAKLYEYHPELKPVRGKKTQIGYTPSEEDLTPRDEVEE